MRCYFRILIILIIYFYSYSALGTSTFHSFITDLSPPYICKLKLKEAKGVSIENKHSYRFNGICSIKIPIGTSWVYQNVWVDVVATWDGDNNQGIETTTLFNNLGTVVAQLKCDDDPWLTKSQCALVGYDNNTQFTNLGGVFNNRNGQYPPFEISTGQYPPLARNQAVVAEAIALSIKSAREEAAAAHAAFAQNFGGQQVITRLDTTPVVKKRPTKIYRKPKIGNLRLDCCLDLNKNCGKPAADRFCQQMGYRHSINCQIDKNKCLPTFVIGSQTVCTQPFCKGFEQIECAN